jgi:hypothetical protein
MTSFIREGRGTHADETVNVLYDIGGSASPGSTTSERRLTFYSDRRFTVAGGAIEAGGIWR